MISRLLIITIGLSVLVSNGLAQATSACPVVTVDGPSGVLPGKTARYSVQVDPVDNAWLLTYKWSSSYGVIKSGQGTRAIEVIQPQNNCLTVTVEVRGLPENCPTLASDTSCYDPPPLADKLVEISGALTSKHVARIKEAIEKHHDSPYVQFYFIVSGTNQKNSRNRKLTALKGLFKSDPDRATYVISEKTDDKVTMWAVPPGANPPTP